MDTVMVNFQKGELLKPSRFIDPTNPPIPGLVWALMPAWSFS